MSVLGREREWLTCLCVCAHAALPHHRWYNHLDPAIRRGPWVEEEDQQIVQLQHTLGNRWAEIAMDIKGR